MFNFNFKLIYSLYSPSAPCLLFDNLRWKAGIQLAVREKGPQFLSSSPSHHIITQNNVYAITNISPRQEGD